ncbi:MAG: single-stranded DNA-binding protein [Spirochaetales bacterium]|nr:single-stranded DNA-binding protein [Spirochaetales bacterium]
MKDGTDAIPADVSREFSKAAGALHLSSPVAYIYNPLEYAWEPHEAYMNRYAGGGKRVLFMGMNPGPWGMVQNGIPFGDTVSVKEWLHIEGHVDQPRTTHPKRPVLGFACGRREQSGKRLWGLVSERFRNAEIFFKSHFVGNYCPLAFFDTDGKNITPDKLCKKDRESLFDLCDFFLKKTILTLRPCYIIGIGVFAEKRIRDSLGKDDFFKKGGYIIGGILHPSPASPKANAGWAGKVVRKLKDMGVWE